MKNEAFGGRQPLTTVLRERRTGRLSVKEVCDGWQRKAVAGPPQLEILSDGFYFPLLSQLGSSGRQRGSSRKKVLPGQCTLGRIGMETTELESCTGQNPSSDWTPLCLRNII